MQRDAKLSIDGGISAHGAARIAALPTSWPRPAALPSFFARDTRAVLLGVARVADPLAVVLGGVASYYLRFGSLDMPSSAWTLLGAAAALTLNAMALARVYHFRSLQDPALCARRTASAWAVVLLTLIGIVYFTKTTESVARGLMALWAGAGLFALLAVRASIWGVVKLCQRAGTWTINVAVVGSGETAERVAAHLEKSGPGDVNLVGIFEPEKPAAGHGPRRDIDALMSMAARTRIDEIAIAVPCAATALGRCLRTISTLPVDISLYPDLIGLDRAGQTSLRPPSVPILERPLGGWRRVMKRGVDLVFSAALVLFLLPLMLTIAAAIKLDSRGPVLFRQRRLGFNKKPFAVYKFRSMREDAARDLTVPQARRNDPRVTRVGRFLRRASFDELPQLLNVLKGDMSLVGPRPHSIVHDEKYALLIDGYLSRLRVKPGITGWAQVNGLRGETDTTEKMQRRLEHDLYYIDHWSLVLDIRILFKTLLTGFSDRNAY